MEETLSTDFTITTHQLHVEEPNDINSENILLELSEDNKFNNSEEEEEEEDEQEVVEEHIWKTKEMTINEDSNRISSDNVHSFTSNYFNTVTSTLDITNNNKPTKQVSNNWDSSSLGNSTSFNNVRNNDRSNISEQWHDHTSYSHQEASQFLQNSIKQHSSSLNRMKCPSFLVHWSHFCWQNGFGLCPFSVVVYEEVLHEMDEA
ncbi:hypothetical protein O3M35_000718 [Rhynocoris fuscipes]|uniref:Uncharacterized protein n=1 Tax=Rhynocoris fuscipes TaxID=488301 RepID=A0AAW1DT85_9HEMI